MDNTGDLSTQVMFLFAEEEWICENRSLEIPAQQNLNLSRSQDVLGREIRQLDPLLEEVVSDPVHVFVNSASSGLLICRFLAFFLACIEAALSNVIILFGSIDLSKELDECSARLFGQLLERPLDSPGFNLSETNTGPLQDVLVCYDVGDVVNRAYLSGFRLTTVLSSFSTFTSRFLTRYVNIFRLYYLLRGSLDLVNIGLQRGSNFGVVVNLFNL